MEDLADGDGSEAQSILLELDSLRLRAVVGVGMQHESDYIASFQNRAARFLGVLWQAHPQVSIELRLEVRDAESPFRFLFSATGGGTVDRLAGPLRHLMSASFPEYEVRTVEPPAKLNPVMTESKEVLLLRRRAAPLIAADRAPFQHPVGFGVEPPKHGRMGETEFWRLTHAGRGADSWPVFLDLVQRRGQPLCLSVRFTPSELTFEEEAFLSDSLERLDSLSGREGPTPMGHLAREAYAEQYDWLQALKKCAARATVTLSSPTPIDPVLIQTGMMLLGRHPTGPAFEWVTLRADAEERLPGKLDEIYGTEPHAADSLRHLFDPTEAASLFVWPSAPLEPLPGVACRGWRDQPLPPPYLKGVRFGMNRHRGIERPVELPLGDLRRHVYVVGQTGTGKTTLLQSTVLNALELGMGACVIDPHGDLFSSLLGRIPEDRLEDVIVFDPNDVDYPLGLNPLEYHTENERQLVVQEVSEMIRTLTMDEYNVSAGQFMGPVFFQHLNMNMQLVMSDPQRSGTLYDLYRVFTEPGYWERWMPLMTEDPLLRSWVRTRLPKVDYLRQSDYGPSLGDYVMTKLQGFFLDPRLRAIFDQPHSAFDFRTAMDEGKIILVNLSKGLLGASNARFLGMALMAKLYGAALRRAQLPESERRDFLIVVDEFQSLASQNFMNLFSEGRKFGVNLLVANQFLDQLHDVKIIKAALGNAGTVVAFRLGYQDAGTLENEFAPSFSRHDLINIPNWYACVRALRAGQRANSFTLETEVATQVYSAAKAQLIIENSRALYTAARAARSCLARTVVQEMFERPPARSSDFRSEDLSSSVEPQ